MMIAPQNSLWVFESHQSLSPEQVVQWWQDCYVEMPVITEFVQAPFSAAIIAELGMGRSIAIESFHQNVKPDDLVITYETSLWPEADRTRHREHGHFVQIIALITDKLFRLLNRDNPLLFKQLNDLQQEFLAWLVINLLGERNWRRLISKLEKNRITPDIDEDDARTLYELDADGMSRRDQVEELVELCTALGFSRMYLLLDIDEYESIKYREQLSNLFGILDLLENPQFHIRASFPKSLNASDLLEESSGRMRLLYLNYTNGQIEQIISAHLQVATNGTIEACHQLADNDTLTQVRDEIQFLYGRQSPAGWLHAANILLQNHTASGEKAADPAPITHKFYAQHKLKLDELGRGAWIGPHFISLHGQLLDLLTMLFNYGSNPIYEPLLDLLGTKDNVHNHIRRLRKEVEKAKSSKGKYVYIQSSSQGYWLENYKK